VTIGARDLGGRVEPGFEGVADAFARTLEGSRGGAAFAAVADGELVVDLWGGAADEDGETPWSERTIALLFSGTKGLVATCMLLLVERGLLDLDAPVSGYWPEFAAAGKEGVLVRHVLAHTAGVPGLRASFTPDDVLDGERMAAAVAAEAPFWPPGTRLAYHAVTFGTLCGELIRRVDGRSAGRFFAEEVAAPLGLDVWIGLPLELEPDVATLVRAPDWGITYLGEGPEPLLAALYGDLHSGSGFRANEPAFHRAEVPAANGIGTARSVARLYGCLARGGEIDGVRLLSPANAELAHRELSRDLCAVTRRPYAYGAGFELQTELRRFGPAADAFGHTGSGGSTHGAWPSRRVGFSYLMSELRSESRDDRGPSVLRALHDAIR
jgi:CubicO group peptidase (beta-lactamase class C family)